MKSVPVHVTEELLTPYIGGQLELSKLSLGSDASRELSRGEIESFDLADTEAGDEYDQCKTLTIRFVWRALRTTGGWVRHDTLEEEVILPLPGTLIDPDLTKRLRVQVPTEYLYFDVVSKDGDLLDPADVEGLER